MGRKSTKEDKTIYQECREQLGLTREEALELLDGFSKSNLEKIEYELKEPTPYEVIEMAKAYNSPELCNYYCTNKCQIGQDYIPAVEVTSLSDVILKTVASLNEIHPLVNRLIQITCDGNISDNEIKEFAYINAKLEEVSLAAMTLKLWVNKTAAENNLNKDLFLKEFKKHKQ